MFGLKKMFGGSVADAAAKFSGRKDFLESVCAAAALISAADGEIEDSEVKAVVKAVKANKALADGFDQPTIDKCINTMLERAGGGRVGRMGLWTEVGEIAKDPEMAQVVVLTALDVAEGDGEIEPQEMEVLKKLAKTLGVNLDAMLGA